MRPSSPSSSLSSTSHLVGKDLSGCRDESVVPPEVLHGAKGTKRGVGLTAILLGTTSTNRVMKVEAPGVLEGVEVGAAVGGGGSDGGRDYGGRGIHHDRLILLAVVADDDDDDDGVRAFLVLPICYIRQYNK